MAQWHWVDLTILGIIAASVITGLIRGFVKELVALCIWVLALWLAYNYSSMLDQWLLPYIHDKTARTVAAFVIVLLGTLIVGGIFNALLGLIMKHSGLSSTDRLLGMVFGLARGVFIVGLVLTVVKMTSLPHEEYSKDSLLYTKFDPLVNWLDSKMPGVIKQAKALDKAQSLVNFADDELTVEDA